MMKNLKYFLLATALSASCAAYANLPNTKKGDPTSHGFYNDPGKNRNNLKQEQVNKQLPPIHHRIIDVELITDKEDSQIASNPLLKKYIKKLIGLSAEQKNEIERYVLLINKIPGYTAEYELSDAGENSVELLLYVKRIKARAIVDANNHGDEDLGKYQFSAFGQILNPFGFNDGLILNLGTSNKPSKLFVGTAGYMKRLNSCGTSIKFLASRLKDNPFVSTSGNDNLSHLYRVQLEHYFILNNDNSLQGELAFERRDSKTSNNSGTTASDYAYNKMFIGYHARHNDFLGGVNWMTSRIHLSLGDETVTTPDPIGFDNNFQYYVLDWFREQSLGQSNFSVFTQALLHYSGNLLPIEEQFFVGSNTVGRGYRTGLISANKGISGNFELRYTHKPNKSKFVETIQPYVFFETVRVYETRHTISQDSLSSWGGGVRTYLPWGIRVDGEVAQPFTKEVTVGGVLVSNPIKVSLLVSKEITL